MQKILIGVASIVLVISLAVAGSILWLDHKRSELQAQWGVKLDLKNMSATVDLNEMGPKMDFKDPATAASFRTSYIDNCTTTFQKDASQAGQTPTSDQLDAVRSACGCVADHVIADLAQKAPMSGFELLTIMQSDQEVPGVTSCAGKLP